MEYVPRFCNSSYAQTTRFGAFVALYASRKKGTGRSWASSIRSASKIGEKGFFSVAAKRSAQIPSNALFGPNLVFASPKLCAPTPVRDAISE